MKILSLMVLLHKKTITYVVIIMTTEILGHRQCYTAKYELEGADTNITVLETVS